MSGALIAGLCVLGGSVIILGTLALARKTAGCLGNVLTVLAAGILLIIFLVVAEVNVCQIWLVGEPLCTVLNRF